MRVLHTSITWLIISLFSGFSSSDSHQLHMVISGNIAGAFADCQCTGVPSGSFARLYTFYERTGNDNTCWIYSGNFLTSYQSPEYNTFLLKHFTDIPFNVTALGEFEFYHLNLKEKVPLSDLVQKGVLSNAADSESNFNQQIKIDFYGKTFRFFNFISPSLKNYDLLPFISFEPLNQMIEKTVLPAQRNDFICVILQGTLTEAESLYKNFPWINGIILGNNHAQFLKLDSATKRFIFSPGIEGEFVISAFLKIERGEVTDIHGQLIDLRLTAEENTRLLKDYQEYKNLFETKK